MGQAADDAVNGVTCEWCGQWLYNAHGQLLAETGQSHGHPVVCSDCWSKATHSDRRGSVQESLNRGERKEQR